MSARPGWVRQALLVAGKDLLIELSTGEIITTSGFFAVLVAVIASLSFFIGMGEGERVAPGVIWVAIAFSSVLALNRTWQREREESALVGLLALPISRSALFMGKALGVLVFVMAVELIVIPVVALFFGLDLGKLGPGLLALCLTATPGIAASGTLFGAMTARTRARELVLAVVLFPLLTPTLLAAVAGTRELCGGANVSELFDYFKLIGVFDAIFIIGGIGMFDILIEG